MSRHRATPPPKRAAAPASRHRGTPRPRYGRIAILGSSLMVTAVAVAGGLGFLPSAEDPASASADVNGRDPAAVAPSSPGADAAAAPPETDGADGGPATDDGRAKRSDTATKTDDKGSNPEATSQPEKPSSTALPANSGAGRRAVFSEKQQRVWLVDGDGSVERTYLVSGSVTDNLHPGTYQVYSRSENAYGIDDSGTMQWFVRFTRGENAAIGFHNIPVDDGSPVQTIDQLGTPMSHGCIRQKESDALAMWEFAPIGTTVVVV